MTHLKYPHETIMQQEKRCWICFGEEEDSEGRWVYPCSCSLVSHEQCLLEWIAENQKSTPLKKVSCPQCGSLYVLSERSSVPFVLMSIADSLVHITAPYVTVLGLGCSLLITSTTFGAYTIMTLFGTKQGEAMLGNPDLWTWRTWVGLPSIPVVLVAARSRWVDPILPTATLILLRLAGVSYPLKITWPLSPAVLLGLLPWVRLIYNSIYKIIQYRLSRRIYNRRRNTTVSTSEEEHRRIDQEIEMMFGRDKGVSVLSALLWPTISSIIGSYLKYLKIIRKYFPDTFQRNILGGCLFVIAKDVANLYYRYERIKRRRSRRVVNYSEIKLRSR